MLFEQIQLETDEKILLVVRKHWFIPFTKIFALASSALLPLLLYLLLPTLITTIDTTSFVDIYAGLLIYFYVIWLLLHWIALANILTDYYLDLWAITSRRIIAIDQQGFFRRFLSSFRLERLQDMNISVKGIIPTLLNFGTIEAQTAGGSNEEFKTANMPDPRGLKALIISAADARQEQINNPNVTQQAHAGL